MVTRDELIQTVHKMIGLDLLDRAQISDISANGVQVHGTDKVNKVVLGVSANLDFLTEAVDAGADYTITHHGLNLSGKYIYGARLDPAAQSRLRLVFTHNLTVSAYHYSLDAQPEFGNNATIIKLLGASMTGESYYEKWGYIGEFKKSIPVEVLAQRVTEITHHDVFAVYGGPKTIKRIGVCSGGARPVGNTLFEALDKKIDLHLSGEIVEGLDHVAKESGLNYFSAGHYATEVFGVQELGKKIKSHFKDKLEVEFIDIPNPL